MGLHGSLKKAVFRILVLLLSMWLVGLWVLSPTTSVTQLYAENTYSDSSLIDRTVHNKSQQTTQSRKQLPTQLEHDLVVQDDSFKSSRSILDTSTTNTARGTHGGQERSWAGQERSWAGVNPHGKPNDMAVQINAIQRLFTNDTPLHDETSSENNPDLQLKEISRRPMCTNTLLRHHYMEHLSFPEKGIWQKRNDHNKSHFHLDICEFHSFNLEQCIQVRNWSKLVIIGDSNGVKYFHGLKKLLLRSNMTCEVEKSDIGNNADPRYFAGNNSALQKLLRLGVKGCRTCKSELVTCQTVSNRVQIEYLSAAHIVDATVQVGENNDNIPQATHQMEFLFKSYYKDRFPDVIILFVPFNHEKTRLTPKNLHKHVQPIVDLLNTFMPDRSAFYWVTCPAENDERKKHEEFRFKRYNDLVASEWIYVLNSALFQCLKSELTSPTTNIHGFVNMVNMSLPVLDWSTDGVHYEQAWYNNVMDNLFSIACHS